jgi:tetratricopeptide (TPR) repeat protein
MSESPLQRGRYAASQGEWQPAYDLLREADVSKPLGGEDLGLLGRVAYASGHFDATIEAWERAYAAGMRAGDRAAAAGAATQVAMHLLFDTALMAPVRGWIRRAEQLVEDREPTPVRAWLAVVRNYERMLSGDFPEARRWAREAIEVGSRCDPGAAAIGRIAEARSLVLDGDVEHGLELLAEAAMATVSGEVDPLATGMIYCELVCALQGLAQYDLAEEWTQAMERWRAGQPIGSLHGRCRVHRAEILRLRGDHAGAETEALLACEELRPYLRREFGWPLTELGQIRLRMGDLAGAEDAFLAAQRAGWDPQPGVALAHLARGETALAATSIRHALDHPSMVPSKELPPNTELRRAPLLDAQVEIAAAAGDADRARWAAGELQRIAEIFGSRALAAGAAAASGKVCLMDGDAAGAGRAFERALLLWSEIGAPYETALARLGLAAAHRAAGEEEHALRELGVAHATFEQIGAVGQAERAVEARLALGGAAGATVGNSRAGGAERRPVAGMRAAQTVGVQREGEFWSVVFAGRIVRLPDLKGMRYLARLFAEPRREFHVLELVRAEAGIFPGTDGTEQVDGELPRPEVGDLILDAPAKDAYRRRLVEIEEDIEIARDQGDIGREERAESERDFLIRELSRAVGLGGRDRRTGSTSERARVSVTRAMRSAVRRLGRHDPDLAEHLDRCVRTGTYCSYRPEAPVARER